ncbi:B12-binding domain-containing radical SAM protein [Geomonas sp. Red276]
MRVLLVVYDNDSYIHWFPQGTAYIAAALQRAGCQVTIYHQDLHHSPSSALTAYLDEREFDLVGLGVIAGYYQYRKMLEIAEAVNRSRRRPFFMLGGHGPSPEPEYFLRRTQADAVVIGEGEETVTELVQRLKEKRSLAGLAGVAYRDGDAVQVNERRPQIQDIDALPLPAYDLFPVEYYRLIRNAHATNADFVMPILSGRGCPFECIFCYRMEHGLRIRSSEAIVDEMRLLNTDYGINYFNFSDELLISSAARAAEVSEAILKSGMKVKWACQGRLNYAKPELLALMKRAGCVFINYGIEALDDEVLRRMNKCLTTAQIVTGIEATLASGISPGFNIIFGNPGDSLESLNRGVEFLLKYDDGAQLRTIRPVTPYPGSPLYYQAMADGLLKDCEEFYETKHINSDLLAVNFTDLSDEEFHRALLEANKKLIANYYDRAVRQTVEQAERLYLSADAGFRGFRQT